MEINSKKSGIASSVKEDRVITKALKGKDGQASQEGSGSKQLELREGQQIKGHILDLRYNEVRIRLEPDKQVVTARISGDIPLAIGEEACFLVTEDNGQHLSLKYLPDNTTASMATVIKALTASSLPLTDRNKALVEELLNHRMPIDKQTLALLSKVAIQNKEASPLSLVLMHKNKIPLTQSNIRQFESYQNGTGQLLRELQSISATITDLLKAAKTPVSADNALREALHMNDSLLRMLAKPSEDAAIITSESPLNKLFDEPSLKQAVEVIKVRSNALSPPVDLPLELQEGFSSGNLSLKKAISVISQLYPEVSELLLNPEAYYHDNALTLTDALPPELAKLTEPFLQQSNAGIPISNALSADSQVRLAALISSLNDSGIISDSLTKGTATLPEIFSFLSEKLPRTEASLARALLSSPEYTTLLEYAFQERYSLPPEKLANEGTISELYHKLEVDMEKLMDIKNAEGRDPASFALQEPVKNLQDNLQFMNALNEMFTYIQLPVQLQNKAIHSELYVFTDKKRLQEKKNLNVLLHLNMPHLGPLNVYVRMEHNLIHAQFYPEDSTTKGILEAQLPTLERSLKEKGYYLTSEVLTSYQKLDFTRDFIEQTSEEATPVRYTFDIRT